VAGDGVTAAAHRDEKVMLATEADRFHDVVPSDTARDEGWPPVDGAIPHAPRFVVAFFTRLEQGSAVSRPQCSDESRFDREGLFVAHLNLRIASTSAIMRAERS
jgi:hypothetical protein